MANSLSSNEYLIRGNTKVLIRDYQGAMSDYSSAIKKDGKFKMAYLNRGIAKKQLGDFTGAISDLDKAVKIDSKFAQAYYHRGLAKFDNGDLKEAQEDYSKALKYETEPEMFLQRGKANYFLRNFDDALEDVEKAIELDGENKEAYYYRGMIKIGMNDIMGAYPDLDTASEVGIEGAQKAMQKYYS